MLKNLNPPTCPTYPIGSKFLKVIGGSEFEVNIHKIHKFEDSDTVYYGCTLYNRESGCYDVVWYEDFDLEMCKPVEIKFLH